MKHQTFEQFQGMWWGGIVGQAVANQKRAKKANVTQFPPQKWVWERKQIAKILLSNTEVKIENLGEQQGSALNLQDAGETRTNSTPINVDQQNTQLSQLVKSGHPLLLLSSIFLTEKHQNLLLQKGRIKPEVIIWHNLIRLITSRESGQLDFASVVEQVRQQPDRKEDSLINQLQQVIASAEAGVSLHQLWEELLSCGNELQMAIALSWFCFISTPQDYKLSILRAASINSTIASVTTALTGTLSGAYNGITAIPVSWQRQIKNDSNQRSERQGDSDSPMGSSYTGTKELCHAADSPLYGKLISDYDSENQVLLKLVKAWLGIYSINHNQELYNYQIDAVATCQTIQPRKTLKIISQRALEI